MELFGYIEKIQKNELEYEQNLNLGSITLAWSSLDTLSESRKKNEMEYEQHLILGSMTLAWSSLGCIEHQKKRNGIRTTSDFGIHGFGMDLSWMHWTKSDFGIHDFGMEFPWMH